MQVRDMTTRIDALAFDAARGDDEALALLVRTYHDRVYRFGRRVCRDGFDADDAVQHAFTKLATRPDVVRDPGALSWLFTVVRHACARMLRPFLRERRALHELGRDAAGQGGNPESGTGDTAKDLDAIPSEGLDPHAALERWRIVHAVHEAISTLERPYREVLVMRDLEGLSGPETCVALGLSEANMKTRLHRARIELRSALDRRGRGEQDS